MTTGVEAWLWVGREGNPSPGQIHHKGTGAASQAGHAGGCWVISRSTKGTHWEAPLLFPALSMDQQGPIPCQREPLGLVLAAAAWPFQEATELSLQLLTEFCSESAVAKKWRQTLSSALREKTLHLKNEAVRRLLSQSASHIGSAQLKSCIKNKIAKPTCFQGSGDKFCLFGDK